MIGRYPRLVVLRTFSKWGGLAGLRVGKKNEKKKKHKK